MSGVHWRRWLILVPILAGVAAGLVYLFQPQPLLVEAGRAGRAPMRVTIEEEGKTRVTDRYLISAPIVGYAQRLPFEVGDPIQEGQVVVQLDPLRTAALDPRSEAEAKAREASAEAALAVAQERVRALEPDAAYLRSEASRVGKLVASGDVPLDRQDKVETDLRRVEAQIRAAAKAAEAARFELEAVQAALRYSGPTGTPNPGYRIAVRAPAPGRVLKVLHKSEGVVSPGSPLVEVANSRSLEVQVDVLSSDAVRIVPGMRTLFERWGGPKPLEGRVSRVEPVAFTKVSALGVEEQRVTVIVAITSPAREWARLGDGYRVEAGFILWESAGVLQVPSNALFRFGDGWAVFVIDNGFARRRKVEPHHRNGLVTEIVSGLAPGETVILHPDDAINEGTRVKARAS